MAAALAIAASRILHIVVDAATPATRLALENSKSRCVTASEATGDHRCSQADAQGEAVSLLAYPISKKSRAVVRGRSARIDEAGMLISQVCCHRE